MDKIRIGTRGSKLALRQAALVQEALVRACGGVVTELVILRTRGDRIQDRPLSALGDKGVFASELEQAGGRAGHCGRFAKGRCTGRACGAEGRQSTGFAAEFI